MSSECRCHTEEWCFYCEMYSPLERKHEEQTMAIEAVIKEFENRFNSALKRSDWNVAADWEFAISKLEGVLAQRESNNSRHITEPERNDQRQQKK